MTKEEAIKHCEEIACGNSECATEHQQLAEWLKELQRLKSLPSDLDDAELKYMDSCEYAPANQEEERMVYDAFKAGAEWRNSQFANYKSKEADEAAEEYMLLVEDTTNSHEEYMIIGAFKAGVKWRDAQICGLQHNLNEAANAYVGHEEEIDEGLTTYIQRKAFKEGAKWNNAQISNLPADIDKAAYSLLPEPYTFIDLGIYGGSESVYSREQMLAMMKAGAEWLGAQIQKLPDNLDEAAEAFCRKDAERMWDYEGKTEEEIIKTAFKAGAEWMAGQGYFFETIMQLDELDDLVPTCEDMTKYGFSGGDKVIVQIRKK